MPLRNRVTPLGELEAVPERGLLYGNRGNLHRPDGRIVRPYQVRRWIACALHFRGRRRHPLLQPGKYTELFFLDEATAFAAGHRPCAECRNADYKRFVQLWLDIHPGQTGADAMDVQLHEERYDPRREAPRLHREPWASLPDGTMVLRDGEPWLVRGDAAAAVDAGRLHDPGEAPRPRRRGRRDAAVAGRDPAGRLGAVAAPSAADAGDGMLGASRLSHQGAPIPPQVSTSAVGRTSLSRIKIIGTSAFSLTRVLHRPWPAR